MTSSEYESGYESAGTTQLQVAVTVAQLTKLKQVARQQGVTMTALVRSWIDGLGEGPADDGLVVGNSPTRGPGNSHHEELLADLLSEAKVQTELLRSLVEREAAATPGGGTERAPVVVTELEVVRPQLERFELQDLGAGLAGSDTTPRRQAEQEDLVVGGRVWIKPWGRWGVVLEEPAGPGGPAYVKADEGSQMPTHFGAGQLEVEVSPVVVTELDGHG